MIWQGFLCKVTIRPIFLRCWNWNSVLWTASFICRITENILPTDIFLKKTTSSTLPWWYWNWNEIVWWILTNYLSFGTNDSILFWDFLFISIKRTIIVNWAQGFEAGWLSKELIDKTDIVSMAPTSYGCCNLFPDALRDQLLRNHSTAEHCS